MQEVEQDKGAGPVNGLAREWFEKVMAGELPPPAIARTLGIRMLRAGDGAAAGELEVEVGKHANPMGTLHGGVLCDLGDLTMGTAVGSMLERGETFTTIELKVNFFKPVRDGRIEATARIVKRTRSVCFVECDVVDAKGSLVARLGSTCMILRGEQAAGR